MSDDVVAPVETAAPATHEPPTRDITDGGPEMVQFLDAEGRRVPQTEVNGPYAEYLADVDGEPLRGLYRDLVLVRRVEWRGVTYRVDGPRGIQLIAYEPFCATANAPEHGSL